MKKYILLILFTWFTTELMAQLVISKPKQPHLGALEKREQKAFSSIVKDQNVVRIKLSEEMAQQLSNPKSFQKTGTGNLRTGQPDIDKLSELLHIVRLERVFPESGKFEYAHRQHGLHLWYEVEMLENDHKRTLHQSLEIFKKIKGIQLVEPRYSYQMERYQKVLIDKNRFAEQTAMSTQVQQTLQQKPNDEFFDFQWHYHNTGQSNGTRGADIRLRHAWALEAGSPEVIVSIHDGGIDVKHEDLAANMWINTAEKNGRSGIDDDNNGFIDDVHGFNFVNYSGVIVPNDHGTHVAGTVGAVTNNKKGVAGVAGGSGTGDGIRLMSAQVFTSQSGGGFENSFLYAADNGAVISQNSWSGAAEPPQIMIDAINYFIERAGYDNTTANYDKNIQTGPMAGGLIIFAAGNYTGEDPNEEIIAYPSAIEQVISVANLDHNDFKDITSLWNDYVDIAAPGTDIASTYPNNEYGYMTGTSMACPHVSGIAALVLSKYKNQGITPDQIRERLLTRVTPVGNLEPNFPFEGKIGSGRANAYQVLLDNDHAAPSRITDLSMKSFDAISITLGWTSPADGNLPSGYLYDLRYATEPITEANFENAQKVNRSLSPNFSGQAEEFTLTQLASNTIYYVALKTSDIFGNISLVSNVVSQKTNVASKIIVDPELITINANALEGTTETELVISNDGDADLTYTLEPSLQGRKKIEHGNPDTDSPDELFFIGAGNGFDFYAASKFVAPSDGFNLLGLKIFYKTENVSNIEINITVLRGGATPDKGTIVATKSISSLSENGRWFNLLLDNSIAFEPNETFWLLVKYPGTVQSPQASDNFASAPGTFYYSINGVEYTDVQTVAEVFATAQFKVGVTDDYQWLGLSTSDGLLSPGASNTHLIEVDASELPNGQYQTYINAVSNDPRKQPSMEIPLKLTVFGGLAKISFEQNEIVFDDTFVNAETTKSLTIINSGQADLVITGQSNPEEIFKFPFLADEEIVIPGKTSLTIPVSFIPNHEQDFLGQLTFQTNDTSAAQVVLNLSGKGIPAPQLSAPDQISLSVASGEDTHTSFTISNQGGNNLNYRFDNILPSDPESELFNYVWTDSRMSGGPVYVWNDISATGNQLSMADNGGIKVAIPINFMFYGEIKDSILISPNGLLTFHNDLGPFGGGSSQAIPSSGYPNDLIAAYWADLDPNKSGASIHYQSFEEHFVVQYTKMPASGQGLFGTATFQIILYKGGTIEFVYKDIETAPFNEEYSTGIEDASGQEGLLISYESASILANELVIRIAPSPKFIVTHITNREGVLQPGASTEIELELSAEKLMAGLHNLPINISTNDPLALNYTISLELEVTGEALPIVYPENKMLDFGTVFVNDEGTERFTVSNHGKRTLTLLGTQIEGSENFQMFDIVDMVEIHPGAQKSFGVSYYSIDAITETAVLTISTDAGDFEFELRAQGQLAPELLVNPEMIELTVEPGDEVNQTINLVNQGGSALQYSFIALAAEEQARKMKKLPSSKAEVELLPQKGAADHRASMVAHSVGGSLQSGYHWIDNKQEGGPLYDWVDLSFDPQVEMINLNDDDFREVILPFRFDFFGKSYQRMYVTDNGLIGFDKEQLSNTWNYRQLPAQTGNLHGFIAPFWYDFLSIPEYPSRILLKKSTEKVVIQYQEAQQFINTPFGVILLVNTFQCILYPDGTIKFQYEMIQTDNGGTVGLESANGFEGVSISFNSDYLRGGLAIMLTPYHEMVQSISQSNGTIEEGEAVEAEITLKVPESFTDGTYIQHLVASTNDPAHSVKLIPIKVKVNGKPKIAVTHELNMGYVSTNQVAKKSLSVHNQGTKPFSIKRIVSENPLFMADLPVARVISAGETQEIDIRFAGDETSQSTTLSIYTDIPDGTTGGQLVAQTKVKVDVDEAPAIAFDETVHFQWSLSPTESDQSTLEIKNQGGGELSYHITAVPFTTNQELFNHSGNTTLKIQPSHENGERGLLSLAKVNLSRRLVAETPIDTLLNHFSGNLQYDPDREPDSFLGVEPYYGGRTDLAVKFMVEEDYFTLTHALINYRVEYATEKPIKLTVAYGGDRARDAKVLHQVAFLHPEAQGQLGYNGIVSLDTTLYFQKSDTIWFFLEYPGSAGRAQAINFYAENTSDKYFYYSVSEGKWLDANILFPGMAFKVKALQENVSWINFENTHSNIPKGETKAHPFQINAQGLEENDYEARFRIKSNDPNQPISSIPMALNVALINGLPNAAAHQILIYPNPTREVIYLKLKEGEQALEASLMSLDGKKMKLVLSEEIKISLPNLAASIYILEVKTSLSTHQIRVKIE